MVIVFSTSIVYVCVCVLKCDERVLGFGKKRPSSSDGCGDNQTLVMKVDRLPVSFVLRANVEFLRHLTTGTPSVCRNL